MVPVSGMLLRYSFLLALCSVVCRSASDQFCISSLNQFQNSLVNRTANLDSLNLAFSRSNYQPSISFIVHYHFCTHQSLLNSSEPQILCKDIEKWVDDVNAGRKPTKDFSKSYGYTFLWNASPINLFIRPDLLASLSLFTFRVHIFKTHIILDKLCENVINPILEVSSSDPLDKCRKPTSILSLLESLTSDLKSFHLHKSSFFTHGIKSDSSEQGHPVYYFDPLEHKDDVCVLNQVDAYRRNRILLAVAIVLTQLIIPILLPFSARIFDDHVKHLITKRYPASTHYFFGFVVTTALLGLFCLGTNVYLIASEELNDISRSGISDVRLYYIIGSTILLVFNPLFAFINIWYNNARRQGRCCFKRCCCCRCNSWNDFFPIFSICVLVFTTNIICFNGIYVFMGMLAAPIQTGSLLLLYSAVFFLFTMFVALIHKGYRIAVKGFQKPGDDFVFVPRLPLPPAPEFRNYQLEQPPDPNEFYYVQLADPEINKQLPESDGAAEDNVAEDNVADKKRKKTEKKIKLKKNLNRCLFVLDCLIVAVCAVLVLADLLLYMAFYYEMVINLEPYTSSGGFLSSFSILVPALFTLTAGVLEKRLINFLSGFDMIEDRMPIHARTGSEVKNTVLDTNSAGNNTLDEKKSADPRKKPKKDMVTPKESTKSGDDVRIPLIGPAPAYGSINGDTTSTDL